MKSQKTNEIHQTTAHLFRECSGKMIAVLTRYYGLQQLENILDAVQESFETALRHWRYKGIPQKPEAWLLTVAKNKISNIVKRENLLANLTSSISVENSFIIDEKQIDDSQLQLLRCICKLNLPTKNQIIFTLYVLCGFGVPEIANALLMGNEAVKKSIFRTKQSLQQQAFKFNQFPTAKIGQSLDKLHLILYLMFNEGYKTTRAKEGLNTDLCYEAMRLTKLILQQNPQNGDTCALLALMFFNISRFPARISNENIWISLEQQDRSLWNTVYIKEGLHYLNCSRNTQQLSKYHLEATIASIHCTASNFNATDWNKIIYLYEQLEHIEGPSFSLSLNKIIAKSYIEPSEDLLKELNLLEKEMKAENYLFLYLAKAHLFNLLHQKAASIENYQLALAHTQSEIDKQFILQKIDG